MGDHVLRYFQRLALGPDTLLSRQQLLQALSSGPAGQFDLLVYEQLWEEIRVISYDPSGQPLSSPKEFAQVFLRAEEALQSKVLSYQQNVNYLRNQPVSSQGAGSVLSVLVKSLHSVEGSLVDSPCQLAIEFRHQEQVQRSEYRQGFPTAESLSFESRLELPLNEEQGEVVVQVVDQQLLVLAQAQFPLLPFFQGQHQNEVLSLELFQPGTEGSMFSLQAMFQLQSVSAGEMQRKELNHNLQEIDDCNHDLYLLRQPFSQGGGEETSLPGLASLDQSLLKRQLQLAAAWLLLVLLANFNRAVFQDFLIIALVVSSIREKVMSHRRLLVSLALSLFSMGLDILWLVTMSSSWSASSSQVGKAQQVQLVLNRFVILLTFFLLLAKVAFLLVSAMLLQYFVQKEHEQRVSLEVSQRLAPPQDQYDISGLVRQ